MLYSLKLQLMPSIGLLCAAAGFGWNAMHSVLMGVLVFSVPNLYFTYYAFRFKGAAYAAWIKQSFLWGEMGKLSLTALGFALIFRFFDNLNTVFLFGSYIAMILLQIFIGRKLSDGVARAQREIST